MSENDCSTNHSMGEGRLSTAGRAPSRPHFPEEVLACQQQLLQVDVHGGWPPRLAGITDVRPVESSRPDKYFSQDDRNASIRAVLKDPKVMEYLEGRWELLGCHLVIHKDTPKCVDHRVRICLFNYTTNNLIEAYVEDGKVQSVAVQESHEHPESPIEIAQAISIARAHSDLKERVKNLDGHAILQVSLDPNGPSHKHRCFHVVFTQPTDPSYEVELPVLFSALVDLRLQKVLTWDAACADGEISSDKGMQ